MGDRANVVIQDKDAPPLFLYTHWYGHELPDTVARALVRFPSRWSDSPYLARIIFSEMIKPDVEGETGFGISTTISDGEDRLVVVNIEQQLVSDWRYGIRTFKQIWEEAHR